MMRTGREALINAASWAPVIAALVWAPGCEPAPPQPSSNPEIERRLQAPPSSTSTPFIVTGIRLPKPQPADAADIADDDEIIGVSVGGRSRAYKVSTMCSTSSHVVNDVLGQEPVTVTYCDRTNCARALTRGGSTRPLDINLGGWIDGRMSLFFDSKFVPQQAEELPFDDVPFERMTWKEWKESHPDTDVFTGADPTAAPRRRAESPADETRGGAEEAESPAPAGSSDENE